MDKEKLITSVYNRRCLWDTAFKGYHIRENARENWRLVAEELNEPCEVVKTKWRNLRDTFRREFQKEQNAKPGDSSSGSKWSYYSNMLFLRDQLVPRNHRPQQSPYDADVEMSATVKTEVKNEDDDDDTVDEPGEDDATSGENGHRAESKSTSSKRPAGPSTRSRANANILKIKTRKMKHAQKSNVAKPAEKAVAGGAETEADADYHFLMSLLPYLRAVPDSRKLHVRTKLQQVFVDEM